MAMIPKAQLLKELLPGLNELFGLMQDPPDMDKKYKVRVHPPNKEHGQWALSHTKGLTITYNNFEDLPQHIKEVVNVLRVVDAGTEIEGIGYKSYSGGFFLPEDA